MVISKNRKPRWFFYPGWFVLNFLATLMAWYITWAIISQITNIFGSTIVVLGQSRMTEDFLFFDILFPMIGLLMGILQYMLLRRFLPDMAWWIAATFFGWLLLFVAGFLVIRLLGERNDPLSIMFGLLLIGATIAIPQWWMLRKRVRYAVLWILANGLGWSLVGLLSLVTLSDPFPVLVAIALIPAMITAIALWLLLDWMPRLESKEIHSSL